MLSFNLLKSKTFWGSLIGVAGWVLGQPHIDLPTVLQGIGALTGIIGGRDAIGQAIQAVASTAGTSK